MNNRDDVWEVGRRDGIVGDVATKDLGDEMGIDRLGFRHLFPPRSLGAIMTSILPREGRPYRSRFSAAVLIHFECRPRDQSVGGAPAGDRAGPCRAERLRVRPQWQTSDRAPPTPMGGADFLLNQI